MSEHNANFNGINYFQQCWDLGYRNLLPVVPPNGGLDNAGKRPGVKVDGSWIGKGPKEFTTNHDTIGEWSAMGAGVGFKCEASGICGIDIDSMTPKFSEKIKAIAFEMLGATAIRIGLAPKCLLLYRGAVNTKYRQVRFDDGRPPETNKKGRLVHKQALVELLAGDSKWFVAWGLHPVTDKPYTWPDGLWPREQLPFASAEQLEAFFDRLAAELPKAVSSGASGTDRAKVDQEGLKGDLAWIAEAMAAIPNEVLDYNGIYVRMAAAARGACQDDPDRGCETFTEWSEKLVGYDPGNKNSPDRVYWSLKPPFALGANYIYDHAERHGWVRRLADRWFDENPESDEDAPYESIFGGGDDSTERISASPWEPVDPAAIPPRDFLYGWHIVRGFASMTVAPSKVGKSSLATVDILAMVTGRTLLPHMKPKDRLRVWYINGEDPMDELQRRIAAGRLFYKIDVGDVGDRLFLDSGRSMRLVTAVDDRSGVKILRPVIDALTAELRARRIDVLVVDPFVSTHQVGENDNSGIDAVMTEWIMVADRAGCAVEFLHHARKAGVGSDPDASIDAARGATSLVAKMRSVRALANMTKAQGKQLGLTTTYRDLFRVTDAASNLAPWVDDETEWLKRESVALGNGDHVAVVVAWSLHDGGTAQVDNLAVLQALGGEAWREDSQARDEWVGHAVALALKLDLSEPDDKVQARRLIGQLIRNGVLERFQQMDKNRKKRWYVKARSVFD